MDERQTISAPDIFADLLTEFMAALLQRPVTQTASWFVAASGALHSADAELAMPFKSQAQRRKFAELLVKGKLSPQTYEEWNRETGSKRLPEHVKRNAKTASRRRTAAKKR